MLGQFHQLQLVGCGDRVLSGLAFSLRLFFQALNLNKHIYSNDLLLSQVVTRAAN